MMIDILQMRRMRRIASQMLRRLQHSDKAHIEAFCSRHGDG